LVILLFYILGLDMNIYVGNLTSNTTEEDLKELFGNHGQVNSVKLIKDFDTNISKGFAFVDMSQNDGKNAIDALNDTDCNGNTIIVNEAYERKPNNGFRSNNNYGGGNRGGGRGGRF
jgi:RNA recognition motif-containing protein